MIKKFMAYFTFMFMVSVSSSLAQSLPSSYTELLKYTVRSPNQAHTDNCLFMGTTGAVEVAVNKYFKIENPGINSSFDFNEKTAIANDLENEKSWFEDPVLRYNIGAVRNKDYPYSDRTFWNGFIPSYVERVELPEIKTNWFLTSENGNKSGRFSYNEFKDKDITKIKEMLVKYRSPIVIIYRTAGNDSGYGYWNTWHTATIVGFDDKVKLEEKCPILEETLRYIGSAGRRELSEAVRRDGGCKSVGGFYVRDSEDPEPGERRVPNYVVKSYDDIKYLGTNAMVVYIENPKE